MRILTLALLGMLVQDATGPLIRDLDDDDVLVRDRAVQGLCKIGAEALPQLQKISEEADTERSLRAREAMDRIVRDIRVRSVFTEPPIVDLRCSDTPVGDLISILGKAGISVTMKAELGHKRVTITEGPMTPLQALDTLCARAGDCEWSYASPNVVEIREGTPTVVPTAYESRFRFSLPHIETYRSRQADRTSGSLCLCIQADHEQGLKPVVPPEIVVEHVVDDSGRELLPKRESPIRVDTCFRDDEPLGDPERTFHSRPVLLGGQNPEARRLSEITGYAVYHFALQEVTVEVPEVTSGTWVKFEDLEIGVFGLRPGVLQIRIQKGPGIPVPRGILNAPAIKIVDQDGLESQVPLHAVEIRDLYTAGVSALHYLMQFDPMGQRQVRAATLRIVTDAYEKKVPFTFRDVQLP